MQKNPRNIKKYLKLDWPNIYSSIKFTPSQIIQSIIIHHHFIQQFSSNHSHWENEVKSHLTPYLIHFKFILLIFKILEISTSYWWNEFTQFYYNWISSVIITTILNSLFITHQKGYWKRKENAITDEDNDQIDLIGIICL